MEDLLTHLMAHHMTDHLNWKLYVGQDLVDFLSKKQSTWGQGEIYEPCKDFVRNHYEPSSATNVFCGFFPLYKETLFLILHTKEGDQVLSFFQGGRMT